MLCLCVGFFLCFSLLNSTKMQMYIIYNDLTFTIFQVPFNHLFFFK